MNAIARPIVEAQFIEKLEPLFQPWRFKVLRGGRASVKSWSVAAALVIIGSYRKLQVLCAREYQSSIRESVHKLLANTIERLGLSQIYDVQQSGIYGPNGTQFAFVGLSDKTAENLKSYEDFDVAWVEEARNTTQRSWNILRPTIRKDGSEIWISFNPELDTDPVWTMFVEDPPPGTFSIELNWRDNPWFNAVLEAERQDAERKLPKVEYENIWEGKCRPTVAGAIYAEEVAELQNDGRVGLFPHDPRLLVHTVYDLGWNDKMTIGLFQRVASQLRLIGYMENDHKTIDWYSRQLRKLPYNWGTAFLPHDGDHGDWKTGVSGKAIMEGLGWVCEILPLIPVVDGIRAARMAFKTLYVHKLPTESKQGDPFVPDDDGKMVGGFNGCARFLECAKRYARTVPATTGEAGAPKHDEYCHGMDMWRYAAQAAPLMLTAGMGMSGMPALKFPKGL
jgi:phage terminase large subunit